MRTYVLEVLVEFVRFAEHVFDLVLFPALTTCDLIDHFGPRAIVLVPSDGRDHR